MKTGKGFSLIELLIVVAIILVIASIAIPNLLKSKIIANEASAVSSLRTVMAANLTSFSKYNIGFAGSLAQLGPTSAGCPVITSDCADLVDSVLSGINPPAAVPTKNGFVFIYVAGPSGVTPTVVTPNATFSLLAAPVTPGATGQSTFCLDQSGVIRKDPTGSIAGPTASGCLAFAGAPM